MLTPPRHLPQHPRQGGKKSLRHVILTNLQQRNMIYIPFNNTWNSYTENGYRDEQVVEERKE